MYACPTGQVFNRDYCKCVCVIKISQCPGLTTWDSNKCKCECVNKPVCNQHQKLNEHYCRCDPVHNPKHNHHNNHVHPNHNHNHHSNHVPNHNHHNNHVHPNHNHNYHNNHVPNNPHYPNPNYVNQNYHRPVGYSPSSVCHYQLCPPKKTLDPYTCRCVCHNSASSCTSYQRFNKDTCKCECPHYNHCQHPKIQDPHTCKCVCPPNTNTICTSPLQVFNHDKCKCECRQVYVTVEFTVPGTSPPALPLFFGGFSRTPGGRIRGFRGKRRAEKKRLRKREKERRKRSRSGSPGRFRGIFFPPLFPQPPLAVPQDTVLRERRIVPAPCPIGTVLNEPFCECN